ncbi:MAG: malto-oligosyltrehalose trehalohydrolase [Tepidisphaeraceae bacterium]
MDDTALQPRRRWPIGAQVLPAFAGVHFRVWAPKCSRVEVVFDDDAVPSLSLEAQEAGYFVGTAGRARAGQRYRVRLDGKQIVPDPFAHFSPDGPHGSSEIVDHSSFNWTDADFPGVQPSDAVVYELHVGTLTQQGTYRAAIEKLPMLRDLGITVIELMPLAEFNGLRNWGYDGVQLFAPTRNYGRPDDLRAFIDAAHALGIAVILDVVYNHLGPHGNFIAQFSDDFFSKRHKTDWGEAVNFDGPGCEAVREIYLANARYWIEAFHFDGFRFDATQNIYDESPSHILKEIADVAREAAGAKRVYLVNENEPQHTKLVRPVEKGGYGLDALWNDDFHHSAIVAVTGRDEAYYTDYAGSAQELLSAAKHGYLFQGQIYQWQKTRRGTPTFDLPPWAFVSYLDNHDQIANNGRGQRFHVMTSAGHARAITTLLLLMPSTPMLFQGQEFAANCRFNYFVDHGDELAPLIRKGREKEISQFASNRDPDLLAQVPDPSDPKTFHENQLDWSQLDRTFHDRTWRLHRDLLALRRADPTFARARRERGAIDGAILDDDLFVIRYFGADNDDRLLVVNLGRDWTASIVPEPLLAPPEGKVWRTLLTTEHPNYGGFGRFELEDAGEDWRLDGELWRVAGRSAVVLSPRDDNDEPSAEGEP